MLLGSLSTTIGVLCPTFRFPISLRAGVLGVVLGLNSSDGVIVRNLLVSLDEITQNIYTII